MSTKFLGEIRAERIRLFFLLLLAKVALVDRLTRMQIRRQYVFPKIFQGVTGVGTMSTLVRFGTRVQTHVSPQIRAELRLEVAALVGAGMDLNLLGVRGILVPNSVPAQLRLRFSGVGAIRTRILLLDVVMDQPAVRLQLGCGTKYRWTTRKTALVLLTGVSQHVLSKGMFCVEAFLAMRTDEAAPTASFVQRFRRSAAQPLMNDEKRSPRE